MGCIVHTACCAPQRSLPSSNAVFISSPLGTRMQVSFVNLDLPHTLLLSLQSAERLNENLSVFAADTEMNVMAFLPPMNRVADFQDFDCCLWFLTSCPKVPMQSIVIYVGQSEAKAGLMMSERYPDLAALIVDTTGLQHDRAKKCLREVTNGDFVECPLLAIIEDESDRKEVAEMLYNSCYAHGREVRVVCKEAAAAEIMTTIRDFTKTLLHF